MLFPIDLLMMSLIEHTLVLCFEGSISIVGGTCSLQAVTPFFVSCRMVKALHIFLLVDANMALTLQTSAACDLAMLIPDLVSLLILIKSTLKACCLTPDSHVRLVKDMLLMPVGPGQARLNLLQVRLPCTLQLAGHVPDLCIYICICIYMVYTYIPI